MKRASWAAPVLIVVTSALMHFSALGGWWLNDDPQVLLHAIRTTVYELFFDPSEWRYLSSSNFTPLVTLSFEADLRLVGLKPGAFYFHQWVVLTIAAILLYFVLRNYVDRAQSCLAAMLFLVSPSAGNAARNLMVRHYLEGLVLSLGALLIWMIFTRRIGDRTEPPAGIGSKRVSTSLFPLGVCTLLYLFAILAKEVFLPLPLFMILDANLRGHSWRRIAFWMTPMSLVVAGYLVWRYRMLGSFGGYGEAAPFSHLWSLPGELFQNLAGFSRPLQMMFAIVLVVLSSLALRRDASRAPRVILVLFIVAFLPLPAIAGQFDVRYALIPTVVVAAGAALATSLIRNRILATCLLVLLTIPALVAGIAQARDHSLRSRVMSQEGRFVWSQNVWGPTLLGQSPGWYLAGLASLRAGENYTTAPRLILSRHALVFGEAAPERVVRVGKTGNVERLTPGEIRQILDERKRRNAAASMSLTFTRKENDLFWSVGSTGSSKWTFLTYPLYDDFPLPPKGWRRLPETSERQFFRIRQDRPDGSWNVSPVLELPGDGKSVTWNNSSSTTLPLENSVR